MQCRHLRLLKLFQLEKDRQAFLRSETGESVILVKGIMGHLSFIPSVLLSSPSCAAVF